MADLKAYVFDVIENFSDGLQATPNLGGEALSLGAAPGVVSLLYRMRATDTTLTQVVFWGSSQVDSAGADYGGPGPLVDVVVHKVLGS